MSEFEYLAVIMSIIFGISVIHVLTGVIRSFYRREQDLTRYVLSEFFIMTATGKSEPFR